MQLLSDEIEVVTGFPASAFVGNRDRSFASVIHPDDHDRVAREIDDQLADQDDFACEYRIVHADGTIVWILERGRRVRIAGHPTALLAGLLFDITDRRHAQEQLRASVAEQAAHRAVADERTNVVRELHDSVGHALSVLALYGGITATQLPGDPEAAVATFRPSATSSRTHATTSIGYSAGSAVPRTNPSRATSRMCHSSSNVYALPASWSNSS